MLVIKIIICYLIADFITGLFHWFEDTYGTLSDSLLSKLIWEPNILHHKNPSDICKNSFLSRNYLQFLMAAIFLLICYLTGFLYWEIALTACIASLGNEVHSWSHRIKNNWCIELLQEMGLVQTKLHHSVHHLKPYNKRYCVMTNFINPILERIHFWQGLEFILSPLITVKRGDASRFGL